MTAYGAVKRAYSTVIPARVRQRLYLWTPAPLKTLRNRALTWASRGAQHDEIYDREYFDRIIEPAIRGAAEAISDTIMELYRPRTVIDVGCGTGTLMEALGRRGVVCTGFEYADAALSICRARQLNVTKFDIESESFPVASADLVVSTEVAEHLPSQCAERYVDLLTSMGPRILLTAAEPGSEGTDHVNEQPNEYWIAKMERRGFRYLKDQSLEVRAAWRARRVTGCYCRSLMLFECADRC